jgi:predicted dienelactone hydrolase
MPVLNVILRMAATACLFAFGLAHADVPSAGLGMVQMEDPVTQKPMKAAIFYPADGRPGITKMGPLEIAAERDAPVRSGRHPLVLLSHGNGASMFSHHDTATFLASQGYLVAAIEHPGDNFRDDSGLGTDRVLVGRNLQLSALLDMLLTRSAFATSIDPAKVGVAGFSAGGYTSLLMVGAKPKFELLKPYCERLPQSVLCLGGGSVRLSSPPLAAKGDARVRAAFVMSPVAAFFDRDSLASVSAPVHLYAAGGDTVLPVQDNAHRIRDNLPARAQYTEIAGAGHFVFLAPCTSAMKSATPALCADPPGVDRQAVHDAINKHALVFFNAQLKPASP